MLKFWIDNLYVQTYPDDINVSHSAANTVIDLSDSFTDPEGDPIELSIHSNNNKELVNATMDGSKLVLDYFPGKSGNGIVSVRATANGLSTYLHQYYYVTDTPPEVAKTIPPLNAKSESAVTNMI